MLLESSGEEDDLGVQETTTAGLDLDLLRRRGKNRRRQAFENLFLQLSKSCGEHWSFGAAMESVGTAVDNIKRARYLRVSGL